MNIMEIRIVREELWKSLNEEIVETGVQLSIGTAYINYVQACKLCRYATDGEHVFSDEVERALAGIVKAWESWDEPYKQKYSISGLNCEYATLRH